MTTHAKIVAYDGCELTVIPQTAIERELMQKNVDDIEIRLNDGRTISAIQRRKIYAIIRDISNWSGHEVMELKDIMKVRYIVDSESAYLAEGFSLSDTDMTTARQFIDYLIRFCFQWDVPTKKPLIDQAEEIGKYLYYCIEFRKCAICNAPADIHHVDRVGMGRDREHICHVGMLAIALCRKHHDMAHRDERNLFADNHIQGIRLDEYLVKKLKLGCVAAKNTKEGTQYEQSAANGAAHKGPGVKHHTE
jgi:hypothetical protein